ncbi:MAG TPA: hypothetical protein VGU25_06730 [Acidobacteriaceae bacterium]|nr:hypothetical protein [Acidobacteriaceae bacterium]
MISNWTKRKKIIVGFLAVTTIPMAVILPRLLLELHSANSAFRNFSGALIAKNYGEAYALTSPELRSTTDYKSFVEIHHGLNSRLGDLTEIAIDRSEVKDKGDGWYAILDAQMIFARGRLPFTFILKKEHREWKVYSYHEQ